MSNIGKAIALVAGAIAITSAGGVSASTIYSTLGGVEAGGDPLGAVGPVLNDWIKTGGALTLTSATFNLLLIGESSGSFNVFAAKITNTGLAQFATLGTIQDSSLTSSFALYTVQATYKLDANSFYVVGLLDNNNSSATWGSTTDPTVLSRPAVVAGTYYYNTVGGLQLNAGGPYELSVNAVPESATWSFMLVGLGLSGVALRRRRTTVAA
jgi:hypothetical protein